MKTALLKRLQDRAAAPLVAAAALGLLLGAHLTAAWLDSRAAGRDVQWRGLTREREKAAAAVVDLQALRDFKARDVARLQEGLSGLTRSRRALFEAGLALQEEKRLLEKQWEMLTTWLLVDSAAGRIHLMRGDQSLESYALAYASAAFGGASGVIAGPMEMTSKERFAHPERGVSEQVDGALRWNPPQVGDSVRANALGEYVMFFRGGFILHGPARRAADHRAFSHRCAGLSLAAARNLYRATYIGGKLVVK
ncbi:MAG: L,D-transpeptidase [Elusimicrobia bacterium]|nr:L,D-transpeptidase [Elusimicrobiota bacterium]